MPPALAVAALLVLLGSPPVKSPEVSSGAEVQQQLGGRVTVVGQLERVPMQKGVGAWHGTALVLDDDTTVYVTYGAPPPGWEPLVGARVRARGLLMPSLDDHSQSLLAPHLRAPEAPERVSRALPSLAGKRVRVSGVAHDAKGGAALLVDGQPLYLVGLDRWPPGLGGKRVVAGGTVAARPHLPEAKRTARGERSQGATGAQLVLEQPTWLLADPPAAPTGSAPGKPR